MTLNEFYNLVDAHCDLKGIAIDKHDGTLAVEYLPAKITTVLTVEAIGENAWDTLEEILTAKREPEVLHHLTRVIGYYSKVENWNKSKVGELAARQRGNYGVA